MRIRALSLLAATVLAEYKITNDGQDLKSTPVDNKYVELFQSGDKEKCTVVKLFSFDDQKRLDAMFVLPRQSAMKAHPNYYNEEPPVFQMRLNAEKKLEMFPAALVKQENETPAQSAERLVLKAALLDPEDREKFLVENPQIVPDGPLESPEAVAARQDLQTLNLSAEEAAAVKNPANLTVIELEVLKNTTALGPLDFANQVPEGSDLVLNYKFVYDQQGERIYQCRLIKKQSEPKAETLIQVFGASVFRRAEKDAALVDHMYVCFSDAPVPVEATKTAEEPAPVAVNDMPPTVVSDEAPKSEVTPDPVPTAELPVTKDAEAKVIEPVVNEVKPVEAEIKPVEEMTPKKIEDAEEVKEDQKSPEPVVEQINPEVFSEEQEAIIPEDLKIKEPFDYGKYMTEYASAESEAINKLEDDIIQQRPVEGLTASEAAASEPNAVIVEPSAAQPIEKMTAEPIADELQALAEVQESHSVADAAPAAPAAPIEEKIAPVTEAAKSIPEPVEAPVEAVTAPPVTGQAPAAVPEPAAPVSKIEMIKQKIEGIDPETKAKAIEEIKKVDVAAGWGKVRGLFGKKTAEPAPSASSAPVTAPVAPAAPAIPVETPVKVSERVSDIEAKIAANLNEFNPPKAKGLTAKQIEEANGTIIIDPIESPTMLAPPSQVMTDEPRKMEAIQDL